MGIAHHRGQRVLSLLLYGAAVLKGVYQPIYVYKRRGKVHGAAKLGRNALFPTYLLVRYKEGEKKGVNKSTHIATGLPVSPLSFSALYFPKWREGDSGRGYFEGGKKSVAI